MANDFSQQHDAFVAKIVADPKQHVDTTLLQGYLGGSSEADSTRIYFDPSLNQYIDVKNEDILHTEPLPKELSTLGGSYIWLRKAADVLTGKVGGQRKKSKFLEGSLQAEYAAGAAFKPPIQTHNPDICGYRTPELLCQPTMYPCYTPRLHCPVQAEAAQTGSPEACQGAQPQYYQPPYQTWHYQHCPTPYCTKVLPICYPLTLHPVCHQQQIPYETAGTQGQAAYQLPFTTHPGCSTLHLNCPSVYSVCPPHTIAGILCQHTAPIRCLTPVCPAQTYGGCVTPGVTAACNPGGGQF